MTHLIKELTAISESFLAERFLRELNWISFQVESDKTFNQSSARWTHLQNSCFIIHVIPCTVF